MGGLFSPRYRRALVAGIGDVLLQQLTGQPSVLYYANTIFNDVGIAAAATVGTGAFKFVATLTTTVLVDRYGRRPLLFIGIAMMFVALLVLTWAFYGYETGDDDAAAADDSGGALTVKQGLIIAAMFLYIGGYQVGFGPIAWTLISEIFPLQVRGQAVALAVQANFASNLIVSFLFPVEIEGWGAVVGKGAELTMTFGIFLVLDVLALWFVYRNVPETAGKTLEQIEVAL